MSIYCCCVLCHTTIERKQLTNHHNSKRCKSVFQPEIKVDKRKNRPAWNRGLTKNSDERLANVANKIRDLHSLGVYDCAKSSKIGKPGKPHTAESKTKLSALALENKYQRKSKRSHEFVDKLGRVFIFDSSWEDALAIRLDELNLEWTRPSPIKYTIDGKSRNYFPDFYLPDYDLYLDPKNSYCCEQQKEKLVAVSKLIKLEIITSKDDCKNWSPRQDSNLGMPT